MQTTHVEAIERTLHKTNEWLWAIQVELDTDDTRHAYSALRAVLHALRDRLNPNEALHLGAQLPTLIRGVYFEGWRLSDKPARLRSLDEFLGAIAVDAGNRSMDLEAAARAVFKVLGDKVSPGEIDDVKSNLPEPIRQLWPA